MKRHCVLSLTIDITMFFGGRGRFRTYDPYRVKVMLSRWATRPSLVEIRGVEPLTFWLRTRRSPNWAISPSLSKKKPVPFRLSIKKNLTNSVLIIIYPTSKCNNQMSTFLMRFSKHIMRVGGCRGVWCRGDGVVVTCCHVNGVSGSLEAVLVPKSLNVSGLMNSDALAIYGKTAEMVMPPSGFSRPIHHILLFKHNSPHS